MKRAALLSIIFSLVISLAAPVGAAFALEVAGEQSSESVQATIEQAVELDDQTVPVDDMIDETALIERAPAVTVLSDQPLQQPEAEPPIPPAVVTPPASPVVSEPVTTPPLIVTTFDVSDGVEFIELYNQSDVPIEVAKVRIQASAGASVCSVGIDDTGYSMPGEFFYVRSPTYMPGHFERQFLGECLVAGSITRIELFLSGNRVQLIDGIQLGAGRWGVHSGAWSVAKDGAGTRKDFSTLKQSGSFEAHYKTAVGGGNSLYSSDAYHPPSSTEGLQIIELLPNSRSCAPDDAGDDCDDFIKVHNGSAADINLAPLRLRVGSRTANPSVTTSFNWHESTLHPARDELVLPAGAYFTLKLRNDGEPLSLSNAESNVWIEDYYGVVAYQSVSYQGMDLAAAREKSWAFSEQAGAWQFGIPSPGRANVLYVQEVEQPGMGSVDGDELKPCGANQYRSEETGRCRSIAAASALLPCREGQYRSEETNRCRSIATAAAAVLKPCADGQFRNPETNRCKAIASAEDIALADCGEGRERNPETNRCRNIVAVGSLTDTLPFPIEKAEASKEQFVGWWVLGVVAAIGIGYGLWEWRVELMQASKRGVRFITRTK